MFCDQPVKHLVVVEGSDYFSGWTAAEELVELRTRITCTSAPVLISRTKRGVVLLLWVACWRLSDIVALLAEFSCPPYRYTNCEAGRLPTPPATTPKAGSLGN